MAGNKNGAKSTSNDVIKAMVLLTLLLLFTPSFQEIIEGHEGHRETANTSSTALQNSVSPSKSATNSTSLLKWIGNLHLVFLHFPIAFITSAFLCELYLIFKSSMLISSYVRFSLILSALTALPTALLGLALGSYGRYNGLLESIFWWHRLLGFIAGFLAIGIASLREKAMHGSSRAKGLYCALFTFLFFIIIVTGYLGGSMSFGPTLLWPSGT